MIQFFDELVHTRVDDFYVLIAHQQAKIPQYKYCVMRVVVFIAFIVPLIIACPNQFRDIDIFAFWVDCFVFIFYEMVGVRKNNIHWNWRNEMRVDSFFSRCWYSLCRRFADDWICLHSISILLFVPLKKQNLDFDWTSQSNRILSTLDGKRAHYYWPLDTGYNPQLFPWKWKLIWCFSKIQKTVIYPHTTKNDLPIERGDVTEKHRLIARCISQCMAWVQLGERRTSNPEVVGLRPFTRKKKSKSIEKEQNLSEHVPLKGNFYR